MTQVKIIADSMSPYGERLTTMQVKFHRFILPEFNTHRVFSRNFSSSRAIPVSKLIEQVRTDPAMPLYWGSNKPGMQAGEELSGSDLWQAKEVWKNGAKIAANYAETMMKFGLHKQVANRLLEPFLWAHGIVSSTEWDNFFALRCHPDAQPEIRVLAEMMKKAIEESTPIDLSYGQWHLPYVKESDYQKIAIFLHDSGALVNQTNINILAGQVSAARCCRVSYLTHDGRESTIDEDIALCQRLAGADPMHCSPFEHQATPDKTSVRQTGVRMFGDEWLTSDLHGNFNGWIQHRKMLEAQKKTPELETLFLKRKETT